LGRALLQRTHGPQTSSRAYTRHRGASTAPVHQPLAKAARQFRQHRPAKDRFSACRRPRHSPRPPPDVNKNHPASGATTEKAEPPTIDLGHTARSCAGCWSSPRPHRPNAKRHQPVTLQPDEPRLDLARWRHIFQGPAALPRSGPGQTLVAFQLIAAQLCQTGSRPLGYLRVHDTAQPSDQWTAPRRTF